MAMDRMVGRTDQGRGAGEDSQRRACAGGTHRRGGDQRPGDPQRQRGLAGEALGGRGSGPARARRGHGAERPGVPPPPAGCGRCRAPATLWRSGPAAARTGGGPRPACPGTARAGQAVAVALVAGLAEQVDQRDLPARQRRQRQRDVALPLAAAVVGGRQQQPIRALPGGDVELLPGGIAVPGRPAGLHAARCPRAARAGAGRPAAAGRRAPSSGSGVSTGRRPRCIETNALRPSSWPS